LPGAAPTLVVEKVLLNQLELPAERFETTVNNPGQQTRLQAQIPALYLAQPALLEVRYQYSNPDKSGWSSRRIVPAPTLDGNVVVRTVRWRVEWPSGWLPLTHGDRLLAEQTWQFLGGLWPPAPTLLADEMEQWLLPGSPRTRAGEERP